MTSDPIDALRDALALTTNLLHQSQQGTEWGESLVLAGELVERHGADVLMAQTHLTIRFLAYAAELSQAAEDAGADVTGVPGGVTPEKLLQEYARQVIEHELDNPET